MLGSADYDPKFMIATDRGDTIILQSDTLAHDPVMSLGELGRAPERRTLSLYVHSLAWVAARVCSSCTTDSAVDWPAVEREYRQSASRPPEWIPLGLGYNYSWSTGICCSPPTEGATRYTVYWVAYGNGPEFPRTTGYEARYARDVRLKPDARLIGAATIDAARRRVISIRSASSRRTEKLGR